jgi:hypothetical protein
MATLIKTKDQTKTAITVGTRVTFQGNLPGGYYDNYTGYTNKGALYGTVVKVHKVNCIVETKNGNQYKVAIDEVTNIEDLF